MPKESSGESGKAISPTAILAKKKKVRGGHKAYLNKTVGTVNALLRETQTNQVLLLKQHKAVLEERLKTITVIDDQVLELLDDEEEILYEIDEAGSFSENVHKILIEIDDKLQSLEVSPNGNAPGNGNSPHGGAASFTKLPKLQLRKFYGKLHKWQEFWDSFSASVDNNSNLSDALKLEYLKCQCEGAANQAIAGLELTNENYDIAVNILKQRFGQRQDILNSHMDALLYINTVHRNAEISELRKFYDTVETHSRGLQSLGVDEQAYGTVLVNVLLKRLPEDIQLIISRKMAEQDDGNDWKLPQLLDILKLEIEAREKCSHGKREPKRNTGDNYATAATLTTGVKNKPKCTFCQGDHGTVDCRIVTSVQERRNILRKSGRCFLCLRRAGHLAKDCDASIKCFRCKGRHHVALCEGRIPGEYYGGSRQHQSNNARIRADQACQTTNNEHTPQSSFCGVAEEETGKGVLLQTAFVTARNPQEPSKRVNLRVILDSGSQRSYISEKARDYLQLSTVKHEDISIKVFGSNESNNKRCDIVKVNLGARQSEFETEISALVVPTICSPLQGQTVRWAKKNYAHLKNLNLADFPKETETELCVDILIGNDVMWRLLTGEIVKGETDETPVAVGTKFGWVLSGVVADIPRSLLSAVNLATTHLLRVDCQSQVVLNPIADKVLDRKVNELFELETLGITEVDSVEETFMKDIQFEEGHYKIKLPWREHHDILPDNYELSVGRLNSTLKRLRKEPTLLKEYDNVIQEQIKSGIVEEVRPNLIEQTEIGRVHYLSHHCVVRKDATTTKVRVVLDGSAKTSAESPSLNECLHTGPSLTPNILDILLRFRSHKIALVSDVEKAFHMIHVDKKDRDVLRFLWINDINAEKPEIVILRYTRIVFGLNCSPFLLGGTLSHHISNYKFEDPKIGEKLSQSIYVDDVVSGCENSKEAYDLYQTSKSCLAEGGFHLRKWRSNDPQLQKTIENETDLKPEVKSNIENDESVSPNPATKMESTPLKNTETKVLGMNWDFESDKILLKFEKFVSLSKELSPTKRNLLKLAASVFDPIGFVSPVLVRMKMLLQETCLLKLEWDTPLPENLSSVWFEIVKDLDKVVEIAVKRCYFEKENQVVDEYNLHGFCDASEKAYCAVIYLVHRLGNRFESNLIASKSRVAPVKKLTIPRLELMGALIMSRLMNTVKAALENEISFNSCWYWSDSTIVLSWLKNDANYKQFVSHRTKEILKSTSPENWNHCPTEFNPADVGSRGQSLSMLSGNNLWWSGPEWLRGPKENYPKQPLNKEYETDQCFEEIRQEQTVLLASTSVEPQVNCDELIDAKKIGSLDKLLRITAYVLRFTKNLKARVKSNEKDFQIDELTANEMNRAETLWIKTSQIPLSDEKNFKQLERELGLFKDEVGIIRCRGRIGNSNLKFETKFPALLSTNHYLTTLIILQAHEKVFHHGVKSTLNEVRAKFWVTRARQKIRKIVHQCRTCKRFESQPYKYPVPPHLPDFRVEGTEAFTSVGTDLAGPLCVRYSRNDKTYHKVWIVIFTCTLSRAVHLEVMLDMSTEQFLLALRRFIGRRGTPNLLISDNAKNFKGASKFLKKLFKSSEVKQFFATKRIEWSFNLSKAPWYGSIYERLIKSVKRCAKKVLRNAKVTLDELYTILVEIEGTLNNRPLTYMSSEEFDQALTPSHLICGRKLEQLPHFHVKDCTENDINRSIVTSRQKHITKLLSHWWQRWKNEYLVGLRETHKLVSNNRGEPTVCVGDIVTVHEEKTPRGFWRLGKIEKVIESKDGLIRGATVRVVTPTGQISLINRPITKLFPVEIATREIEELSNTPEVVHNEENRRDGRPRRAAALDADLLRKMRDEL